jgi:hypothetical protein
LAQAQAQAQALGRGRGQALELELEWAHQQGWGQAPVQKHRQQHLHGKILQHQCCWKIAVQIKQRKPVNISINL